MQATRDLHQEAITTSRREGVLWSCEWSCGKRPIPNPEYRHGRAQPPPDHSTEAGKIGLELLLLYCHVLLVLPLANALPEPRAWVMRSLQVRPQYLRKKKMRPSPESEAVSLQSFACNSRNHLHLAEAKQRLNPNVTRLQGVMATVFKRQSGTWKPVESRTCSLCMTLQPEYWLTLPWGNQECLSLLCGSQKERVTSA